MRPVRLEVQGFTAFREPTLVDFEGIDLFALVGPTGSGKSSLIDAMVFALYGSVPRYDDTRLVAPVISQGLAEARIRLDFAVGNEQYTAVRVVRRTPRGATTKEARLERVRPGSESEVIAGNQAELTEAVERILGLSFTQFTTCVVLPQGEAARFLHDTPKDRQELLIRLLDLGLYKQLAARARERASTAEADEAALDRTLAELGAPEPAVVAAAEARVGELDSVVGGLDELGPRQAEADAAVAAAQAEVGRLEQARSVVHGLEAPAGVAELAGAVSQADGLVVQARTSLDQADLVVVEAEKAMVAGPDGAGLDTQLVLLDRVGQLEQRVAKGRALVADSASAVAAAVARRSAAADSVGGAKAALAEIEIAQRAEALVAELVPGQSCPVCQQVVTEVPHRPVANLDWARAQLKGAEVEHRGADDTARQAENDAARLGGFLGDREEELARLQEEANGLDRQAVEVARVEAASLAEAVDVAHGAVRQANKDLGAAEQGRDRLEADMVSARRRLDSARDKVAVLGPPEIDRTDLAADWEHLVAWAAERNAQMAGQLVMAGEALTAARSQLAAIEAEAVALVSAAGLTTTGLSVAAVRDSVVAARATAAGLHSRLVADAERASGLAAERDTAHRRFLVADRLGRLLGARGFEKWLLDAAVDQLLVGASEILGELSAGQYSLVLDERGDNFMVVDHRNAGDVRLARTLSGGETFLASLALALSLADRVASLSTSGAVRLESMILDEGFGTLDPDTLDVVASAIEELGASGRMIGVVSHVRELAERIPTRFEVRTGPRGSSVERVEL